MATDIGDRSLDLSSVDMDLPTKRQLSPDQRSHLTLEAGLSNPGYDAVAEYVPRQPLGVAEWPMTPFGTQDLSHEPVFVVPGYRRDPMMPGYSPYMVSPQGSLPKFHDDNWSGKKHKRGLRKLTSAEDAEPPRSCMRECVIYFGGVVILAVALTAIIAIVYTYNSSN